MYGKIILKWISEKCYGVKYGRDSSGRGQKRVAGSYEHGNEPLSSVKYWEFLDWLSDLRLLKTNFSMLLVIFVMFETGFSN
jgi:hypothetical protein